MPRKKTASVAKEVVKDNEVFLTEEGFKGLQDELHDLKNNRRKDIAEKIKSAIALGDLSENAEYEEAKNEQSFIEGRIVELEVLIKNAKIFKEKKANKQGSHVQIGNKIELYNETTKEKEIFTIVGSIETDPLNSKISNESPVGSAILGSAVNDVVNVKTPGGDVTYKVVKIH